MREAAKINVDTVKETEEDKAWTARFLYPDSRKPYKLFFNQPHEYKAGDLVARARRATMQESEQQIKDLEARIAALSSQPYRFTKNGQDQPITDGDIKVMDGMFKDLDSFFKRMSAGFRKLGGR